MITKARVVVHHKSTGIFLAESSAGSITVFELLEHRDVRSGEILSGPLEALGSHEIDNETRDERLRVFIHERGCDLSAAIEKYFAPGVPFAPPCRPMWPGGHSRAAGGRFHDLSFAQ